MNATVEHFSPHTRNSHNSESSQSEQFQFYIAETTAESLIAKIWWNNIVTNEDEKSQQYFSEKYSPHPFRYLSKKIQEAEAGGLPTDWYLLKDTGFHIDSQLEQLQSHLKNHDAGATKIWLDQVFVDMGYFDIEYFMKHDFIPYMQAIKEKGGRLRLVAPNYGDIPVVDVYDEIERQGATKRAYEGVYKDEEDKHSTLIKMGIEEYLSTAPDNTIIVRTSPAGWSGYDGYNFPDTQTYFMQKVQNPDKPEESLVSCFTVITDMNVEQNEEFLRSLGANMQSIEENKFDEYKLLSTITETWVPIEGSSINDVLSHLERVANNKTKQGVSFDMLRSYYSNFRLHNDVLSYFDDEMVLIAGRFRKYAKYIFEGIWNEDMEDGVFASHIIEELGKGLAYSILEISKLKQISGQIEKEVFEEGFDEQVDLQSQLKSVEASIKPVRVFQNRLETQQDILEAIQFVQKQKGCAGGGNADKLGNVNKLDEIQSEYIQTVLGPRAVVANNLLNNEGEGKLKTECVTCPFCNEVVDALIEDGKLKCPSCNKKAGDSA